MYRYQPIYVQIIDNIGIDIRQYRYRYQTIQVQISDNVDIDIIWIDNRQYTDRLANQQTKKKRNRS